ncbi:MAG: hypothetical protein HPY76_04880 [Anaerolineae bacterium]|nr:hypothetical protein [Anaerolineae bacterium]
MPTFFASFSRFARANPWLWWLVVALLVLACLTVNLTGFLALRGQRPPQPTHASAVTGTPAAATSSPAAPGATPTSDAPGGRIVYTCMISKNGEQNDLCLINADGSGFRRLTTNPLDDSFYASFSPDGESIIYAGREDGNNFIEIFELRLADLAKTRLGCPLPGHCSAPTISPDGRQIVFTYNDWETLSVWIMDRDGSNPRQVSEIGWDPVWSPDGSRALFAGGDPARPQLFTANPDGSDIFQVTNLDNLRGRSDWSVGGLIATYQGTPWYRQVVVLRPDGSDYRVVSPPGGNSQGPSFSPDGQWIAFTGYYDHQGDTQGCEIYIMRVDGSDLTRLTDNDYCDWQPRWGR